MKFKIIVQNFFTTTFINFFNSKRQKAEEVAQSRMSEDGSPTHSHELVQKLGVKTLEKGI